ncbi:hypothetical protein [Wolbachia endosymbiont (group A) of Anomoia purmunda]|uniref:hypothetical protein n=1 Tax=Wolbachia endosymbiont (group A) of Anomoia purmunda TaxID=2953978 RepID=UPI002231F63C|nr:hypothetical protein [Wolbachia endosymbiont (group A) of Anomoia purmunda]
MQQSRLESSFLYKFTKSASFYNAKPILTKPNALLAIKFPEFQCLGTASGHFRRKEASVSYSDGTFFLLSLGYTRSLMK